MGLFTAMAVVEIQLKLYFAPKMMIRFIGFLWSSHGAIAMVWICLLDAYTSCPDGLGKRIEAFLLPILIPRIKQLSRLHNRYDLNIRGVFMHVCETLVSQFDRLEIAIGKWGGRQLYEYSELKETGNIRLLVMKGRWFFSRPSCELIEVPLDEAPPFEAISYHWGLKPPSIPINVNGALILVTSAIDELLWYRRSIFTSHCFWIDAICINQTNLDEKSSQIPMMTQIYGRATRVVVWLGAPESRKDTRITRKMIRALNWPEIIRSTTQLLPTLFGNEKDAFVAVGKLFSHPWFERIWIVQEVAAGKTVHVMYHGICMEWEILVAAANRLSHNPELRARLLQHNLLKTTGSNTSTREHGQNTTVNVFEEIHWAHLQFLNMLRVSTQGGKILPLAGILVATFPCKATNPRDKIFAVLGISEDAQQLTSSLSYKDELEQVFLRATAFVLSTTSWFHLLSAAGRGYDSWNGEKRSELAEKLPSWVPDYSCDMIAGTRHPSTHCIRSKDPAGRVTFLKSNEKIIQLEVLAFDKIKNLGPKAKFHKLPDVSMREFSSLSDYWKQAGDDSHSNWYLNSRQLARQNLSSNSRSQAKVDQHFWQFIMKENEYQDAMSTVPTLYSPLSVQARKLFESFLSIQTWQEPPTMDKLHEMNLMAAYLARRLALNTSGRVFCITEVGHMALVPPLARKGDTLVHVRGGYLPMVLREKESGVRRAELVGTCLVEGVQDVHHGIFFWEDWILE